MAEHLGDPGGVLVLDETGFVKKGGKSAGVQRQYSGRAGRIENCQIGVFLAYASRYGRVPDRPRSVFAGELGLGPRAPGRGRHPQGRRVRHHDRRGRSSGPSRDRHRDDGAEGPKLGLAMLERTHAAGLPFAWVTADSDYGADHALRRWLQEHGLGYVLAVTCAQRLGFDRVEHLVEEVPADGWHRLSAGEGAQGPRFYDWAYTPDGGDAAPSWEKGLLIRRSLGEPQDVAFYLTHAAHGTALADLGRWPAHGGRSKPASRRPRARSASTTTRSAPPRASPDARTCGEGAGACCAGWTGWHRHVTLVVLARAYLAVLRKVMVGGRAQARPGGRTAPAHRPGSAPPALASCLAAAARSQCGPRLVTLATPPPTTRPSLPPAAPNLR